MSISDAGPKRAPLDVYFPNFATRASLRTLRIRRTRRPEMLNVVSNTSKKKGSKARRSSMFMGVRKNFRRVTPNGGALQAQNRTKYSTKKTLENTASVPAQTLFGICRLYSGTVSIK